VYRDTHLHVAARDMALHQRAYRGFERSRRIRRANVNIQTSVIDAFDGDRNLARA
jgi:hypothetical protein